jgi:hypothetical protein
VAHRLSYWKTVALALAVAIASLAGLVISKSAHISGVMGAVTNCMMAVLAVTVTLIAAGGLVCLWRDRMIELGIPDPVGVSLNRIPPVGILSALGLRPLLGKALRPGDIVTVRSLAEIQSTLDADSSLDGLPFMPEMHSYCGLTLRVHRRVDKIYDMRNKTGMRRLRDAVSLTAVRCNGVDHGGCQAECQILWKNAWLRRQPANAPVEQGARANAVIETSADGIEPESYICQMTRLWEASLPMSRFDIRQDLCPLLSGNVSLWPYVLVLLARLFDTVQQLRRGMGFPFMPDRSVAGPLAQTPQRSLTAGASVLVRDRVNIAQTLINNKTKGLWYDRDMVRYCGNVGVVERGVDHIIHEGTGKMVKMKTRCWILRDVTATGEFHRLCPQHEHIYWREAWLQSVASYLDRPEPAKEWDND